MEKKVDRGNRANNASYPKAIVQPIKFHTIAVLPMCETSKKY